MVFFSYFLRWLLTEQELAEIRGFVNIEGKRKPLNLYLTVETSNQKETQGPRKDRARVSLRAPVYMTAIDESIGGTLILGVEIPDFQLREWMRE